MRDYECFSEESRIADLVLDPEAFPTAVRLQREQRLGRSMTSTLLRTRVSRTTSTTAISTAIRRPGRREIWAPEGVTFIRAADSPIRLPLLAVANEVSGTTTIYKVVPVLRR
ncbi:MAG: hypothetical protein H0U09_14810 [Geodermatophilaceae bacterium]|nr:hypothetical protein [Geodermatophilaceae bacterium]